MKVRVLYPLFSAFIKVNSLVFNLDLFDIIDLLSSTLLPVTITTPSLSGWKERFLSAIFIDTLPKLKPCSMILLTSVIPPPSASPSSEEPLITQFKATEFSSFLLSCESSIALTRCSTAFRLVLKLLLNSPISFEQFLSPI